VGRGALSSDRRPLGGFASEASLGAAPERRGLMDRTLKRTILARMVGQVRAPHCYFSQKVKTRMPKNYRLSTSPYDKIYGMRRAKAQEGWGLETSGRSKMWGS
jgi:hypothetical protein